MVQLVSSIQSSLSLDVKDLTHPSLILLETIIIFLLFLADIDYSSIDDKVLSKYMFQLLCQHVCCVKLYSKLY